KRLTSDEQGAFNNTCVKIDESERLFGVSGIGSRPYRDPQKRVRSELVKNRHWKSIWEFNDKKILVTQSVELVAGEQTRLLDTCLVHYLVENRGTRPHDVGLRVMIDTYIGANDGVPFLIPGESSLVETQKTFSENAIPEFIRA